MKQFKILSKFILIYICFVSFSCKPQAENKLNIKGNWQIVSNSAIAEIIYTEFYINDKYIAKYDEEIGLFPVNKYKIEGNSLIILSWSEEEENNIGRSL